ncbi:MAG: methyltransferase domain-containing protein [Thaumarchaeota archaeon]|nr:methyltransferase domain-containing protein [Nitrososphaerota archaeon]
MRRSYVAAEDSAVLRNAISAYSGESCLEIGAGNGGNLIEASASFLRTAGTDLVRPDLTDWQGQGVDFVLTDLAACFRDGTFDLVFFNPPYLETENVEDIATDGGKSPGATLSFLREALRAVKPDGRVLMLVGGTSLGKELAEACREFGFAAKPAGSKHMFYEELTLYEVSNDAWSSRSSSRNTLQ